MLDIFKYGSEINKWKKYGCENNEQNTCSLKRTMIVTICLQ